MRCDHRVVRELTVGRRIGFYKIRGEIGCGNFSHVKMGIHALTKGKGEKIPPVTHDTCNNEAIQRQYSCLKEKKSVLPKKFWLLIFVSDKFYIVCMMKETKYLHKSMFPVVTLAPAGLLRDEAVSCKRDACLGISFVFLEYYF